MKNETVLSALRKKFAQTCPFITFFLMLASCQTPEQGSEFRKFPVIEPLVRDTTFFNEYVADIHSLQNVEIRSKVKGFIDKVHVDEGQIVKSGQVLFTISRQEYEQDLEKANALLKGALAEMKQAELELQNTKGLVEKKVVSQAQLDLAQAKYDAASARADECKAEQSRAALYLSYTEVRAPFNGVIDRFPYKAGSLIEEGTLLTTISNNEKVYAWFNVSEKEYLDLSLLKDTSGRRSVTLLMANGAQYAHSGIIETAESEIDKSTGNIAFRACFPNPESILKNGSSGKIRVSHRLKNVLLIPQKSTFEIQDNLYVFVLGPGNHVEQRKIEAEYRIADMFAVKSGLKPGERFVSEGHQQLRPGDAIEPFDQKR